MTPIADMVEEMLAACVPHGIIVSAIRVAERPVTVGNALPKARSRKAVNQKSYRERNKGGGVALAASPSPVTEAVTLGNTVATNVTSAPLSILPSLTSSDVLFEEKKEKKKEVSARARGARLPDDWRPDEAGWDFAAARGHAARVIEDEILKFRNYWTNRTDKQACKPRWDRAWQNWILNVKGNTNGQSSVLAASSRLVERVRQFDAPAPPEQSSLRSGEGRLLISAVPHRAGERS